MRRITAYMHEHLHEDVSLDDLAAQAAVSKYHLLRSFAKSTGFTPYRYLVRLRMCRAANLLRDTGQPVLQISTACGYRSPGQFPAGHLPPPVRGLAHRVPQGSCRGIARRTRNRSRPPNAIWGQYWAILGGPSGGKTGILEYRAFVSYMRISYRLVMVLPSGRHDGNRTDHIFRRRRRSLQERNHGYRRMPPLSDRPEISAPDAPAEPPTPPGAEPAAARPWRADPLVPLFALLAFRAGGPERSLRVLAPVTTFALPAIAMVAFWWEDWPGIPWGGLGRAHRHAADRTGRVGPQRRGAGRRGDVDLPALFDSTGGPVCGDLPHTMPLAAGAFTAMLQLTMVSEGWPLRGLGRVLSGVVALAVSWTVGNSLYPPARRAR